MGASQPQPERRGILTIRLGLLAAFATLVIFVSGAVLTTSLLGTARLASGMAQSLMAGAIRETEMQMHGLFDPIRNRAAALYVRIRLGTLHPESPVDLKDALLPGLYPLRQVGSAMLGDPSGRQFLVMRYDEAVYHSPLLQDAIHELPPPKAGVPQYFTREFRPAEWGERSVWTLWDVAALKELKTWERPLPGYDPRQRPWHQAAMNGFRDEPLSDALARGDDLVSWTDFYTLFTTKDPGISAAVAGRDPQGRIQIIALDLLLDEIARFTSMAPTPHGKLFVMTDDFRLLGPPGSEVGDRTRASILKPVSETGWTDIQEAVDAWRTGEHGPHSPFSMRIGGERAWVGFSRFVVGRERSLWIGVILPESDLVPEARANQKMIILIGIAALAIAAVLAGFLARGFARPLAELASQSRRIASLDLAPSPEVRSRVAEVRTLSRALAEMRDGLQAHIAAREASDREVRRLTENMTDVVTRFDRDGRCLYANPAVLTVAGLAPEQIVGRRIDELGYPEENVARWRIWLREVFEHGRPLSADLSYETCDGRRWFNARICPEFGSDGQVETVVVFNRDITERVLAEQAVRDSESRYRLLVESGMLGIVVLRDARVLFANPAAAQMLGYSGPEALAADPSPFSHIAVPYRDEILERMRAVSRGESLPAHEGWPFVLADGSSRWIQSASACVEWEGAPAVIAFLRNVTALRDAADRQAELELQLRQAQKMEAVGLLAGGVAHDFNNLLQIIGGNAVLSGDERCPSEDRRVYLQEITDAVQRASQMTRQLLAFSRRQPLQREFFDLRELVSQHLAFVRRLMPENIQVHFVAPTTPATVFADRGQIEQVLLNLGVNARDAMPDGGAITITVENRVFETAPDRPPGLSAGTYARLGVSDTGHGMDEATRGRIFEPFFSTKPKDRGTGLGLSVAYGIVVQHGGAIDVESEPRRGASFFVYLPIHADGIPEPARPSPSAQRHGCGRVLLAEDNDQVRRLAERTLARVGYTVVAVGAGDSAWERFEADPDAFDLLFFDVMMPGLTGPEAAGRCRGLRPGIPVVFASGYAAESLSPDATLPEGAILLQKPYGVDALVACFERVLAKR